MVRNTKFKNTWNRVIALFRCLCFSPASSQFPESSLFPESIEFPEDLTFEIFLRLPVKSLLRFRCVSKSFLSIIDSQLFIKEHAHRSLTTKSGFQLMFMLPRQELGYVDFGNGNSVAKPGYIKHPIYRDIPVIVGCCNGIICLRDNSETPEGYTFWNPSTRKFKEIEPLPHGIHYPRHIDQVTSGFGYDHRKDDYKIIRMDMSEHCPCDVQVYSLKSNSWRMLDIQLPVGYIHHYDRSAFVQGTVHWVWTSPCASPKRKIAAFHLGSETFRLLPLPPHRDIDRLALIELEDQLCVIGKSFYGAEFLAKITIWVMEEYGNKDSWKIFQMDFRNPSLLLNLNRKFSFFPVSRGKSIAYVQHKLEWFLTDVQLLEDITTQDSASLLFWHVSLRLRLLSLLQDPCPALKIITE